MIVNFNTFKEYEVPLLRLCNANDVPVCTINNPIDFNAEYNFNDFSTISFRVDYDTDRVCYENACVRKEIYLGKNEDELKTENNILVSDFSKPSEDCGYFIITEVEEVKNETERYKNITAKSCEYELSNIAMPYIGEDDKFGTFGSRVLYHATDFDTARYPTVDSFLDYADVPCVMREIADRAPGWTVVSEIDEEIEGVADKTSLPTRKFDTSDTDTIYGFLMNTAAEAYGCVFVFDIYHRIIYIKSQETAIESTDIVLSQDQLLENVSLKQTEDDRINCVLVSGSEDVDISNVNPLGGKYIYYFTEEYDGSVMSSGLWNIVRLWMQRVNNRRSEYITRMKNVHSLNARISSLTTVRTSLEQKMSYAQSNKDMTESMTAITDKQSETKAVEVEYYGAQIDAYSSQISTLSSMINSLQANLSHEIDSVGDIMNELDFYSFILSNSNNDESIAGDLYSELVRIIKTYTYTNSNIVISNTSQMLPTIPTFSDIEKYEYDVDTSSSVSDKKSTYTSIFSTWISSLNTWESDVADAINELFSVYQELYDEVYKPGINGDKDSGIITRLSMPRCDITIDSSNFIFVNDFLRISEQLKTGCAIRIEKPNGVIQEHHVLKISVDYSGKDFSMTLSNRYRLDDPLSIFEDSYSNNSSTIAAITTSNAIILNKQKKQIDALNVARQQSLNRTKQEILSADNQEIIVDDSGMIVRTVMSDDGHGNKTYDDYQFKLANGSILFTEDGWETASLAVGRYFDPRTGKWKMGINGEHIMANTIEASSLTVGLDYTATANLIKDGSFDGNFLNNGSAWAFDELENDQNEQLGNASERNVSLIIPDNNDSPISARLRTFVFYESMNARKTVAGIPVLSLDGSLYLNMFLNGEVSVSCNIKKYNTSGRQISNVTQPALTVAYDNQDKSVMKLVTIATTQEPFDGTMDISLTIACLSSEAYVGGVCLSDQQYGFDVIPSGKVVPSNLCGDFSMTAHHAWDVFKIKSDAGEARSALNITNGVLSFTDDDTYAVAGLLPFQLKENTSYAVDISMACDASDNPETALVNIYITTESFYSGLKNCLPAERTEYIRSSQMVQSFGTYINFGGGEVNKYFVFDQGQNGIDKAVLFAVVTTNATPEAPIELLSLQIYSLGQDANNIVERKINLWNYNRNDSLLGLYSGADNSISGFSFAYDNYKYVRDSGGFDGGKYVIIPPGTSIQQRIPAKVFGDLLYYISAYVQGYINIIITWYDANNNFLGSHVLQLDATYGSWNRVHCDQPIQSPSGSRYAFVGVRVPFYKQTQGNTQDSGSDIESNQDSVTQERIITPTKIDGVLFEQSSSLNPYKRNEDETYAQYVSIDSSGIDIHNGRIRIYNDNDQVVLRGDEKGNLEMTGKITATSGKIGGWNINSSTLSSYSGLATIDSNEGSFVSKSGNYYNSYSTKLESGSLGFLGNANGSWTQSGYIRSGAYEEYQGGTKNDLIIGTVSKLWIKKFTNNNVNNTTTIAAFGDTIEFYKNIGTGMTVLGDIVSKQDILASRIFEGVGDSSHRVVIRGDYDTDISKIWNEFDRVWDAISKHTHATSDGQSDISDTPSTSGSTNSDPSNNGYEVSGNNSWSPSQTDWSNLYGRMCAKVRENGGTVIATGSTLAMSCDSIARSHSWLFDTSYSVSKDPTAAYNAWSSQC